MGVRIAIVDYGMGNLASVERAVRHVAPAADVGRVDGPEGLRGQQAVILPGVGAFDAAVRNLRRSGLMQALREYLEGGGALLGICLGFQLLFEASDEVSAQAGSPPGPLFGPPSEGLGWFGGRVRRFEPSVTVPHMGWSALELTGVHSPLLRGVPDGSYVYFAHSYYPPEATGPSGEPVAVAWTRVPGRDGSHGVRFVAAAWRGAAGGVQFHPEKSGAVGLRILANFIDWALFQRSAGVQAVGAAPAAGGPAS